MSTGVMDFGIRNLNNGENDGHHSNPTVRNSIHDPNNVSHNNITTTTTTTTTNNNNNNNNKRIYSKGGCRECKRRKIKCDEGKPACWQCLRLKKECSYPALGEKVLRVSKKQQKMSSSGSSLSPMENQRMFEMNRVPYIATNPLSITSNTVPVEGRKLLYNYDASRPTHGALESHQRGYGEPSGNAHSTVPYQPQSQLHPPQPHSQIGPPREHYPQEQYPHPQGTYPSQSQLPPLQRPLNQPHLPRLYQSRILPIQENGSNPTPFKYYFRQDPLSSVLPPPQVSQRPGPTMSGGPIFPNQIRYDLPSRLVDRTTGGGGAGVSSLLNNSPGSDTQTTQQQQSQQQGLDKNDIDKEENSITPQPTLAPQPSTSEVHSNDEGASFSTPPTLLGDDVVELFELSDLNLLASDLQNMVNGILYNIAPESKEKAKEKETTEVKNTMPFVEKLERNVPVDFIKLENAQNKSYLDEFYYNFSNIVLPFASFDKEKNVYFNPARDILLSTAANTDYVLAAVLANGAHTRFTKTRNIEDEEFYYLYLNDCLKLLHPAISDNTKLSSKIESVLLTVLLLTAANAADPKQDWRPHLRGAKDLLMKCSSKIAKPSKVFVFCKAWFVTLEVLAGISSKKGGTLQTEEETDELFNLSSEYEIKTLKDLGLILDNGFNIMGGYHHDCYGAFRELIKILNRKRSGTLNAKDSLQYVELFAKLESLREIDFVKDPTAPGSVLVEDVRGVVISWSDVSHKSYMAASMITLLQTCFDESYTSPQVQVLTNHIIDLVSFVNDYSPFAPSSRYKADNGLMMLQWPVLVAGQNLEPNDSREMDIVRVFFEHSSRVGSGGALIALRRVKKVWRKRTDPSFVDDGNESEDLLSY
ncbi:hypothetical protein KGF57_005000 [Candida theae]|uniref:Zn(2)-C6 fungal-type domain-containing protein n=1 Tax=Candida theae TaxID=1198502 RepID=A0AAD5BA32_9ASCO|nr:uncharacterized protein KGF57_005000 [Candida theae]KAI5949038.1 hypothetical protein KGF57_005000 [Candida theae]